MKELVDIAPRRADQFGSELDIYKSDRIRDGWEVEFYENSTTSGYKHREALAQLPTFDHLFQIGNLPQIYVYSGANTHFMQWLPEDRYLVNRDPEIDTKREPGTDQCNQSGMAMQPYAHTGWLTYDDLVGDPGNEFHGLTEAESTEQYGLWFARSHEYSINRGSKFPPFSRLNDHLNYPGLSFCGDAIVKWFAKYPKLLNRFSPKYLGNWDDGELRAQTLCLINMVQSGGFDYQALYNYGYWYDMLALPIQALIASWFGSHMVRTELSDSFVRMSMVDRTANPVKCKVLAAIHNHYGEFNWDAFFGGKTLGEARTASGSWSWCKLMGDPTMILYPEMITRMDRYEGEAQVTEEQFNAAVAAMKADNAALRITMNDQFENLGQKVVAIEVKLGILAVDPLPPPSGSNLALATNDGVASASSAFGPNYPASAINNGDRKGLNWANGGGWNSIPAGLFPQWVEIDLPVAEPVNRVVVCTCQDNFQSPIEPDDALAFTKYGVVDFTIQAFINNSWLVVTSITGNNKVKREVTFATITAAKWRVNITKSSDGYCRIVELEIYGP